MEELTSRVCAYELCDVPITGHHSKKYCCHNHRTSANHKRHGYAYHQKMRSKDPRSFMVQLLSYKNRRATLDIDYLMTIYDSQEGLCAITKVPMTNSSGKGKLQTNISIDRIDSSLGYTEGNIQLVCTMVNKMKSDSTKEEFEFWIRALYKSLEV